MKAEQSTLKIPSESIFSARKSNQTGSVVLFTDIVQWMYRYRYDQTASTPTQWYDMDHDGG